jgi:hypothetical protein
MSTKYLDNYRNTPSPKTRKKKARKSAGFIDEVDNVRVNLETSFVLTLSDSGGDNLNVDQASRPIQEPILTPPSPPIPYSHATNRRRRSSSGGRRSSGGPYLIGDEPLGGGGVPRRGAKVVRRRGTGRVRTRGGGFRGRGIVDSLMSEVGLPMLSDRICKTCEMGYEDDVSDVTHCGKCRRKLHRSCYNGDGCRNCNYDPNM